MKEILLTILAFCLVIFSLYFPFRIAYLDNQPKQVTVGPNQTYTWASDQLLTRSLETTFSLKSPAYFELRQGEIVKQAVYETPVIGETNGLYWIRDFPMTGTWATSAQVTIFSLEESSFTISATFWYKFINYFLAVAFCAILLLISLIILVWLDSVIPG